MAVLKAGLCIWVWVKATVLKWLHIEFIAALVVACEPEIITCTHVWAVWCGFRVFLQCTTLAFVGVLWQ